MAEQMDVDHLVMLLGFADRATDPALMWYWRGRIDGHCLQNAIDEAELVEIAEEAGFTVGWGRREVVPA